MYTGYFIVDDEIHGPDGATGSFIQESKIVTQSERTPTYYLLDGLIESIRHIYGPAGYTHFYLQGRHLYGPGKRLPWINADQHQHHPEVFKA
jgi:hypothetical protein